jgi:hypothetical protein
MTGGVLTLACLFLTAGAPPAEVWPLNQESFELPFRIDEAQRAEIKEVLLFCSTDQGTTWTQVAVSTPDKTGFRYFAPTDGMYWFSVCVVDRQGKREPPDIYKSPPGQKVLVDTLKPNLRLTVTERQGDEILIGWEIQEDHPDLASLKLEYRTPESPPWLWTAATIMPALVGQARFRPNQAGTVSVRMQIADQAGNIGTAQAEVPAIPGTIAAAIGTQTGGTAASPLPLPPPTSSAAPFPVAAAGERQGAVQPTGLTQGEARGSTERPWPATPGSSAAPTASNGTDSGTRWAAKSESPAGVGRTAGDLVGNKPLTASPTAVQLWNSTQVSLKYEATPGPSGIGKVELWITTDDGRSWKPFAEDPDLKPPIDFELPGDGVYGFCLVVYSKAMRSRKPPQPGEPPQMRLEVDTTPPECLLGFPVADPRRRDAVVIPYTVTDRNPAANPATLQWAEQPDGQWRTIAEGLPANGRYSWVVPPEVSNKINIYLRLVAVDNAGNRNVAQSKDPVSIDLTEPEGRILGLAGAPPKP